MSFEKPGFRELYTALETDLRRRAPVLTDWEEGSVVRSLFESVAWEMALLYEQMQAVYDAGYVDTASGPNLDRVVAVLGITRNEPDFATGVVTFERDPGSTAAVTVPAGTLVTTPATDGERRAYLTIEDAVLAPGETAADARVQAEARGAAYTAESETVTVMPRPAPGIKAVRNARPIRFLGRERETDGELRARAKNALLASGRASATSIENALLSLPGVRGVRVVEDFPAVRAQDAGGTPAVEGAADAQPLGRGVVKVYVDGLTPENAVRLTDRVDEVRAAGVFVLMEPAAAIQVEAVLLIEADPRIRGEELARLEARVAEVVVRALDRQRMGEPLLFSRLTKEVLGVEGVTDLPDFRVLTFREGRAAALGEAHLTRSADAAAAGSLAIPADTVLQTTTGERFQTTRELLLETGRTSGTVPIRAVRPGREGELMRTGSGVRWQELAVDGTALAVRNQEPVRIPRTAYLPDARRIPADVEERFTSDRVRVAAGVKTLAVHVRVPVTFPSPEKAAAAAAALIAALTTAGKASPPATALPASLDAAARTAVAGAVNGWFTGVRGVAAALPPLAGVLDAETVAALGARVRAYFAEATDATPVRIVESDLRDVLQAVLDTRLTPAAVGAAMEGAVPVALAEVQSAAPPFPVDAVTEALRMGLRRAADAEAADELKTAADAEAALLTASTALSTAADALRRSPSDVTLQARVEAAEAEVRAAQTRYQAATRALEAARVSAARTLETELVQVPQRVAALQAWAAAQLAAVDSPATRAAVAGAVGGAAAATVGVRLRTVGYDGDVRPDQPFIEPGFVETPEAATVFVYTRTLPLSGTLPLTLPFTATEAERATIRARVEQAIADHLDSLGPEEGIAAETLRAIADRHPDVVGVGEFVPSPLLGVARGARMIPIPPLVKAVPGALALEG